MGTFSWPLLATPSRAPRSQVSVDTALAEARERGYAEGRAQAEAELAQTQTALLAAAAELSSARATLQQDYELAITNLAQSAAEALLRVELVVNPEVVSGLVDQALDLLNTRLEAVSVRVHPEDTMWLPPDLPIALVTDDSVPRGGVTVALPDLCVEFDLVGRLREQFDAARNDHHESATGNA